MTSRLSLLFASTVLSAALGLPSLAAAPSQGTAQGRCAKVCAALFGADDLPLPLVRVSGDDDDDDDEDWEDDDEEEEDDDEEGEDDDEEGEDDDEDDDEDADCDDDDGDDDGADDDGAKERCSGAQANPAPAGTVAPPANGLFGTGAPPVAVTN